MTLVAEPRSRREDLTPPPRGGGVKTFLISTVAGCLMLLIGVSVQGAYSYTTENQRLLFHAPVNNFTVVLSFRICGLVNPCYPPAFYQSLSNRQKQMFHSFVFELFGER